MAFSMNNEQFSRVVEYFKGFQDTVCAQIEGLENSHKFKQDQWSHTNGGGGRTRILTGDIIESGGANFSHVLGNKLPPSATVKRPELAGASFEASGVSIVMHPDNPYIPTSHANIRVFRTTTEGQSQWWFGGGFDLTPFYPFEEDVIHWHEVAQKACGNELYQKYKKQCDEYFYLKHRNETRGVGGIFFDDLNEWGFDDCFEFIQKIGAAYLEAYLPIVKKRMAHNFEQKHKDFQKYRRGRYVEFNLVFDRGTLFGLQSGGRTESILMSMPPEVSFRYNYQTDEGSEESKLYDYLSPREWL